MHRKSPKHSEGLVLVGIYTFRVPKVLLYSTKPRTEPDMEFGQVKNPKSTNLFHVSLDPYPEEENWILENFRDIGPYPYAQLQFRFAITAGQSAA